MFSLALFVSGMVLEYGKPKTYFTKGWFRCRVHWPRRRVLLRTVTPKGSKFMTIVGTAYDKARLSEDEAQRVNEASGLADLIAAFIEENRFTNKYEDEERKSNYGYLSGYAKPKSILEQTNRLRELFPGIGYADEKLAQQPLPEGAEGLFAIPRWEKFAPTYGEAVQKVLDMIKKTRSRIYNYLEGQLGPTQLRQHQKTAEAFQKLGEVQQGYDILVVPAQFGIHHRGRSVRRAREVMGAAEFGLGAFAVGVMILMHPERLQHYDDLWIDCAGDERSPDAGGSFDSAPCFDFDDGEVRLGGRYVDHAGGCCGSASGFVSQALAL